MPQTLTAVPDLKLRSQKAREITRRPTSPLRALELRQLQQSPQFPSQIPNDERIALFPDIHLRIPVGKLLAILAVIVFGLLLASHFAQVGAFLSGFVYDPANATITGDPVITGAVDWLPILLVGLSAVVLAGLTINRVLYRRDLRQAGPTLVSRPARPTTATKHLAALAAQYATNTAEESAAPADAGKLFLVPSTPEDRHDAQEQVRLERDARASALARADAAARLVISGSVRAAQSEPLVVPSPRRVLASMPAPAPPRSGVFFPAAPFTKQLGVVRAERHHLSRAPHTPQAMI